MQQRHAASARTQRPNAMQRHLQCLLRADNRLPKLHVLREQLD
jgi:hypothetical protein